MGKFPTHCRLQRLQQVEGPFFAHPKHSIHSYSVAHTLTFHRSYYFFLLISSILKRCSHFSSQQLSIALYYFKKQKSQESENLMPFATISTLERIIMLQHTIQYLHSTYTVTKTVAFPLWLIKRLDPHGFGKGWRKIKEPKEIKKRR